MRVCVGRPSAFTARVAARAHAPRCPRTQYQCSVQWQQCVAPKRPQMRRACAARAKKDAPAADVDPDYDAEFDAEERMEKSIHACERELMGIRTGRAQPAMLSTIEVDYYGAPTPLQSLAGISTPDSQTIMISPFDMSAMQGIESAIMNSGLGFTPNNDGKIIRINVPPLTEQRRKEMTKVAKKAGEDAKVAVRNVRRDVLKKADKLDLPADELKDLQDKIQKLTDGFVKQIDACVTKKNKDLTTV